MHLEAIRAIKDWLAGTTLDYQGANQGVNAQLGTNLLLWSESLDNAVWVKEGLNVTVTPDTTPSPVGTVTADTLTFSGTDYVTQAITDANPANKHYTFSFFQFDGSLTFAGNQIRAQVSRADGSNLQTYAAVSGQNPLLVDTSVVLPTGWRRLYGTYVANGTTNAGIKLWLTLQLNIGAYVAWGAQLCQGDAPLPYRQTTTAATAPFSVDAGDTVPDIVTFIGDVTRDDTVAANALPVNVPAIFVSAASPAQADGEVIPGPPGVRDARNLGVAIRYIRRDINKAAAFRDASYTVRAIVKSLKQFCRSENAAARLRNNIQMRDQTALTWGLAAEWEGSAGVTAAVISTWYCRDLAP